MKFIEFESIMSSKRMRRYVNACGGDTRKAMALYRYNLRLSQEMFTIISCYEVALRNAIHGWGYLQRPYYLALTTSYLFVG